MKAAMARIGDLEETIRQLGRENADLRELALLYCQIAYRDGFEAGVKWFPDQWSGEAHELSGRWVDDRKQQISADLAGLAEVPKEA